MSEVGRALLLTLVIAGCFILMWHAGAFVMGLS